MNPPESFSLRFVADDPGIAIKFNVLFRGYQLFYESVGRTDGRTTRSRRLHHKENENPPNVIGRSTRLTL